jgi:putative ABC transporter-associated repeat protein
VASRIESGALVTKIKDTSESVEPQYRAPGDVVLQLLPESETAVPSSADFAFLGAVGAPLWQLTQTQQEGLLWPGWSTEEIPVDATTGGIDWALTSAVGPGEFALYESGDFGEPKVLLNTRDGVTADDKLTIPKNTHAHGSWAFSAEGVYCLKFTRSATLTGGTAVSNDFALTFAVGNVDVKRVDPSGCSAGTDNGKGAGQDTGQNTGKDTGQNTGQNTGKDTGPKTGPDTGRVTVKTDLAKATVKIADKPWTGKAIKTGLKITANGKTLKAGTDYTLSKFKKNKNIGKAQVRITGKGNYTGAKTVTFKIVPKATRLTKTTAVKKSVKASWKKVSKAQKVTRYQVRYRVNGTSVWKTKTYSSKSSKATVKGLKKGKKYQFQVRSYKTVAKVKYRSAWSPVKTTKKIR